jgi:starch phosphorylase
LKKIQSLSLIEEGPIKFVRMANLCIVGSHTVNGVARIHSELLKTTLFKDFYELNPGKFQNKTNGVTPRRWIRCCNPGLANLYTKYLRSEEWLSDLTYVKGLVLELENPAFISEFQAIKQANKKRLAKWIRQECGILINEDSLFDVMVKRMHEYKRQLMNALYVAHRYLTIKDATPDEKKNIVARTIMIGGKAAPGTF